MDAFSFSVPDVNTSLPGTSSSTPVAEFSTVVPPAQQANANAPQVSSLNSFLSGLAGLATPVAQIVAATQAPKVTATTNTGDGQKALPTVQTTPTLSAGGIAIDQKTLLIAGAALLGVLLVVKFASK